MSFGASIEDGTLPVEELWPTLAIDGVFTDPTEPLPNGDKCSEGTFSASLSDDIDGRA